MDRQLFFEEEPLYQDDKVRAVCVMPAKNCIIDSAINLKSELGLYALLPLQTHSLNVREAAEHEEIFEDTDAIVTFRKDLPVGVITADCVPILISAPDIHGIAAVHAGWKGTLGGIVDNTLDFFEERGADFSKMRVIFGPSISKFKYEVDTELADRFVKAGFGDYVGFYGLNNTGKVAMKPHIDLQGVNRERFLRRGICAENIHMHFGCSYDTKREDGSYRYQSHRRSNGAPGRMLTYIKML